MSRLPYPAQVALLSLMLFPVGVWVYFNIYLAWALAIMAAMLYGAYYVTTYTQRESRRSVMPEKLPDTAEHQRYMRDFKAIVNRENWEGPRK